MPIVFGAGPCRSSRDVAKCLAPANEPHAGRVAARRALVRKRWLAVATSDRSSRVSDNGIEHLFGNAAAECGLFGPNNRSILTPYAAAHVSRRACRTSLTSARLASRMEGTSWP